MWHATWDGIRYRPWSDVFSLPLFSPDWKNFSWELVTVETASDDFWGYDAWNHPRTDEITLVSRTIESLKTPWRIHIAGISCAESIELIRGYYRSLGYEDQLAKNYVLPSEVFLTVSISLRHLLWCEKDKNFLNKRDTYDRPYYAVVPPLRSPHDLRSLQQGARMGIVSALEVLPGDEIYIQQILQWQILTPFQMSQLLFYRWEKYGFIWSQTAITVELPQFTALE